MRTVDIDIGNGKTAQLTEPERKDFDDNLGGAVQYILAYVVFWTAKHSGNALGTLLGSGLVSFLERIEPHLVEYYSPLIKEILAIEDLPLWLKTFLEKVDAAEDEVAGAIGQAVLGSAAGGVTGSLLGVLLANATYALNRKIEPARPVLPDAVAMKWRSALPDELFDNWIHDQGWSPQLQGEYESVLRPRLTVMDLLTWMWRTGAPWEEVKEELELRGYYEPDTKKLYELAKRLPGPGDLVTFALREVWRADLRPELLTPNAPELYYELMAKHGFDRERAEDYWASHWRLPSAAQGFEMFWRLDEFTEDDLKQLLVRLDILPAYQDNLIQIAYQPITRVDVRRMHATGQIQTEDLPRHYRDIGFSPEYAQMMTDFTVAYNAGTETDFTKSEILKAYSLGALEDWEAVELLEGIGKPGDYAWFLILLEEYKRAAEIQEQEIAIVEGKYTRWEIDQTTARTTVAALGLTATHVNRLLEEWGIARRAKITLPTKTDLRDLFLEGFIGIEELKIELTKRGYPDYAIKWYYDWWTDASVKKAQKAAAEAQAEEERIIKAQFKDNRKIAIAHINAQIAYFQLAIAEFKQAKFVAETDEQRARIDSQILAAQTVIKELQLQKSELPIVEEGG